MRTFSSLGAAALLAAAATAAPAAAAPWSPPAPLPSPVGTTPFLALDSSGPRAVYWSAFPGPPTLSGQVATFVSLLGTGFVPGVPQPLSPSIRLDGFDLRTTVSAGGSGVVLPAPPTSVATGPLAGPLRVRAVPAAVRDTATNAAGDIAVVVEPCATRVSGCHPAAPSLVIARRGHGFGRPISLGPKGHAYDAAVAIDPRGRVLAVWDRDGRVYARFASATGKLGPAQRLATETAPSRFQAVLPGDGRAAAGWTSQSVSEGDARSPFTAAVALATPGRPFGRAHVLETIRVVGTGRYVPYRGLVLRLPARQPGLAAWTGYAGGHYVARAAPLLGTAVGVAQVVSLPALDTVLADAAEGSRGEAAILLLPGRAGADPPIGSQPDGLVAVTRAAPDQPFGAIEQIQPGPGYVDGGHVGIDAATGTAFATWRNVGGPIGWAVRLPIG